jgi:hypothetical protein
MPYVAGVCAAGCCGQPDPAVVERYGADLELQPPHPDRPTRLLQLRVTLGAQRAGWGALDVGQLKHEVLAAMHDSVIRSRIQAAMDSNATCVFDFPGCVGEVCDTGGFSVVVEMSCRA